MAEGENAAATEETTTTATTTTKTKTQQRRTSTFRRWSAIETPPPPLDPLSSGGGQQQQGSISTDGGTGASATTNTNTNANITAAAAATTRAVHETELVAAINNNTNQQSHKYDIARLQRHQHDTAKHGLSAYEDELRSRLSKAIFVGHINTDLDSVAGAMGAAELFGGTAALAEPLSKINGEIIFALKNCGLEPPLYFDNITGANKKPICLVDHTEQKQMIPSIRSSVTKRVIGVIDHHALATNFATQKPIYMDVRPWGSMSTIVGYLFVAQRRGLPKNLATLLLQAILSDTLNLRSVTTTEADRSMVALLHNYAGIGNATKLILQEASLAKGLYEDSPIDYLSKKQFQAKTNWVVGLGPYEMVRGDQKDFACGPWKFGISVLEVTSTEQIMKCAGDILLELRLLKKEKALIDLSEPEDDDDDGDDDSDSEKQKKKEVTIDRTKELDFAFLFVVNVVEQTSVLLIAGGRELALANAAFMNDDDDDSGKVTLHAAYPNIQAPGKTIQSDETAMSLPKGYVSRKAQFVPAFFKAIEDFEYENDQPRSETETGTSKSSRNMANEISEKIKMSKISGSASAGSANNNNNNNNNNDDDDYDPRKHHQQHGRRQSSNTLRLSFRTNAMSTTIYKEDECDNKLIQIEEQQKIQRNGNLYNSIGRVIRPYISLGDLPEEVEE